MTDRMLGFEASIAQKIANELRGKYWDVTANEWWVAVQGVAKENLILLTNDPMGIEFKPDDLNTGMLRLRDTVLKDLVAAKIVNDDGTWTNAYF